MKEGRKKEKRKKVNIKKYRKQLQHIDHKQSERISASSVHMHA
jgi:hypothetical protein